MQSSKPANVIIGGASFTIPWHNGWPLVGTMRDLSPLYRVNDAGTKYCFHCNRFLIASAFISERLKGFNNPACTACTNKEQNDDKKISSRRAGR